LKLEIIIGDGAVTGVFSAFLAQERPADPTASAKPDVRLVFTEFACFFEEEDDGKRREE
jgi:hypothetical protein